jgi:hypothetical protein
MAAPATTPTPTAPLLFSLRGRSLATPSLSFQSAFTNPLKLDIVQIVNQGGVVVWNLTYLGISTNNPTTWTKSQTGVPIALLGQFFAPSFVEAFTNPGQLDILQIVAPGDGMLAHTNYFGVAYLP